MSITAIQNDGPSTQQPKSAIAVYCRSAVNMRRKARTESFTVLSYDNVRENGVTAKAAVLGPQSSLRCRLAAWTPTQCDLPCTIWLTTAFHLAATEETLQLAADQLGVYILRYRPVNPSASGSSKITCEWSPGLGHRRRAIRCDVVPFEMMKLRMLNGSQFSSPICYLGAGDTIADTMTPTRFTGAVRRRCLMNKRRRCHAVEGTDIWKGSANC